ncbi:Uma2 family endonuclease, partial [Streptomyces sp. NPDC054995]
VYAPGQKAPLPTSIGAELSLDVDEIVRAGSPKR